MKIVSGGQTGVDQGALDAAIECGVEHGGWCPKGRRSESGRIPERFELQQTDARDYAVRTRANVRDSDGTLILHIGALQGGTKLTLDLATQIGRPAFCCDLEKADVTAVCAWLSENNIEVINVAGPRESNHPGIQELAREFISEVLNAI